MIAACRVLDDAQALSVLRDLLSVRPAGADSIPVRDISAATTINCAALTRLNYPLLQAMLRLSAHHRFTGLEHLQPALRRYGVQHLFDPSAAGHP